MFIRTVVIGVAGVLLFFVLIVTGILFLVFPRVSAAPDLQVELTSERVARGDYLFNNELACVGCHTPMLEPRRFSGVSDPARIGAGRYMGGSDAGFPGEIYPPNLTPTALADWSDGEIYRAITSGVTRDGRAMFALMPYPFYSTLDPEDVKALVAYLRSLPPQPVTQPQTDVILPVRLAMRFVARDPAPQLRPVASDAVALGKYLTTVGACFECHTKRDDKGVPVGVPFAGGNIFGLPGGGLSRSANITPDVETGIGGWSRADFIARFKSHTPEALDDLRPLPGEMDTEMPWSSYAGMTEEDLGAIYAYLRTVPAEHAEIVTFETSAVAE